MTDIAVRHKYLVTMRGHLIPSNAMKKPGVGIAQGIGVQPVKSDLERGWNLVVNKASNR